LSRFGRFLMFLPRDATQTGLENGSEKT